MGPVVAPTEMFWEGPPEGRCGREIEWPDPCLGYSALWDERCNEVIRSR